MKVSENRPIATAYHKLMRHLFSCKAASISASLPASPSLRPAPTSTCMVIRANTMPILITYADLVWRPSSVRLLVRRGAGSAAAAFLRALFLGGSAASSSLSPAFFSFFFLGFLSVLPHRMTLKMTDFFPGPAARFRLPPFPCTSSVSSPSCSSSWSASSKSPAFLVERLRISRLFKGVCCVLWSQLTF